jgi:hypothetical protein
MSDCETDYAETEYQKTTYDGSDSESESEDGQETQQVAETPRGNPDAQGPVAVPHDDGQETQKVAEAPGGNPKAQGPEAAGTSSSGGATTYVARATLPAEVNQILRDNWSAWKEADKNLRKTRWKDIVARLRALEIHREMEHEEWLKRLRVS